MYLDPSFGGMLIQIIVAIVAGSGAIIFGMRRKIMAFFKKNKNGIPANVNAQSSSDGEKEVIDMLADKKDEKR
jgi:hypothetical protein